MNAVCAPITQRSEMTVCNLTCQGEVLMKLRNLAVVFCATSALVVACNSDDDTGPNGGAGAGAGGRNSAGASGKGGNAAAGKGGSAGLETPGTAGEAGEGGNLQ